jgi:hypothetical protein
MVGPDIETALGFGGRGFAFLGLGFGLLGFLELLPFYVGADVVLEDGDGAIVELQLVG